MVIPASHGGGALLSLRAGGHTYAVPAVAVPYLGRGLAPGLFDVAALMRAEAGGRLPIRVSYHGHRPVLPGVRFTGPASGYLTAASAKAFGAALDRQYQADRARGSYGTDGMFGGGVSITLPGTRALAPAHGFPMRTLTVTGTDLAGTPDTGDSVFVWNVDNGLRSDPNQAFSGFYHGVAKFSVAAGHYWAVGIFGDAAFGATAPVRLDVLPQFTVSADTTVHLAARAADSKVTMVTPRPAVAQSTNFYLVRALRSGPQSVLQFSNFHSSIWVSPASHRTTVGWIPRRRVPGTHLQARARHAVRVRAQLRRAARDHHRTALPGTPGQPGDGPGKLLPGRGVTRVLGDLRLVPCDVQRVRRALHLLRRPARTADHVPGRARGLGRLLRRDRASGGKRRVRGLPRGPAR